MFDTEHTENLIIRQLAGTISPEQLLELEQLIADHPEILALREKLRERFYQPDAVEAIKAFSSTMNFADTKAASRRKRGHIVFKISTAAAALLIITAGVFWWSGKETGVVTEPGVSQAQGYVRLVLSDGRQLDLSKKGQQQAGGLTISSGPNGLTYSEAGSGDNSLATIYVPAGKDYSVQLSDGTEVQLNSGTSMSFPFRFSEDRREITINGEAYLTVAKNPQRPFLVHLATHGTNDHQGPTVEVLGTAFNVNTYNPDQMRVSLVEGSILMKTNTDSIRLKPGLEAVCMSGDSLKSQSFDRNEILSWRDGVLEFKGATLRDVFEVMPRWYGIQLKVDDPSILGKTISGTLDRKQPATAFLKDLKFTHNIDFYEKEGVIHINSVRQ